MVIEQSKRKAVICMGKKQSIAIGAAALAAGAGVAVAAAKDERAIMSEETGRFRIEISFRAAV